MPDEDDATKRRLQAYFAQLDDDPVPPGIDRMHRLSGTPPLSWRQRFLVPTIGIGVAAAILLFIVVVTWPGRRTDDVDVGGSGTTSSRTAPLTVTTGDPTTSEPVGDRGSSIATPPAAPTTTAAASSTTAPSSTAATATSMTATGPLFKDDFSTDPVGSPPFGWTIDSGTWSVVAAGSGRSLQATRPKGQEGRITNGSASWTNTTVSAGVRRDADSTFAGVGSRYQDSNNYYFCKIDGRQLGLGVFRNGQGAFLKTAWLTVTTGAAVTLRFTASGTALGCSAGGTTLSADDSNFATGRMALLQDGAATFSTVVVSSL